MTLVEVRARRRRRVACCTVMRHDGSAPLRWLRRTLTEIAGALDDEVSLA